MKNLLHCANKDCAFTTKSEQLLRKHQSAKHAELKKRPGPDPKEWKRKSRVLVNQEHYLKVRSKSTDTTQTAATVVVPKKPKSKAQVPKKNPFANCEPSNVIGMFHWLGPLTEDEAVMNMKCPKFWRECCDHGLDPLWAYRYMVWRLGHPRLTDWRLNTSIPEPTICIEAALAYIREEWVDCDDGDYSRL